MELDEFRLDRTAVRVTTKDKEPLAHEYWLQQSAEKRLSAIEFLRRQYAGTERRPGGAKTLGIWKGCRERCRRGTRGWKRRENFLGSFDETSA